MLDRSEVVDRIRVMLDTVKIVQATLLAGAIAFFALLSVVPLAVVIVAIAATIGGSEIIDPVLATFDHLITAETVEIVETGLEADGGRSGATIAGLVFAIWSSMRVFRALDRAFNSIYGNPGASSLFASAIHSATVLFALLGIAGTVGIALLGLSSIGITIPAELIPVFTIPLLTLVLLPMYAVFPPGPPVVRDALPGAILAAVGITLATAGFQLYITIAAPFAVYGILAGVFVAMLWLYSIAVVILVGAVANATDLGADRQLHVDAPV